MLQRGPRHTGWRTTVYAGLCLGLLTPRLASAAEPAPQWTVSDALEVAFSSSPAQRAQQAALEEVASGLLSAKASPYNPQLALEAADRSSPGGNATDLGLSLSQELEIAGQRRQRIAAARNRMAAAEATFQRERSRLGYRVEAAFAEAVRSRELLAVAETDAALAREMSNFSRLRLERGATTQIEVNLAQASAGRAEGSLQRGRAAYASARSRLAEIAGGDPGAPPEPLGELLLPGAEPPPLEELLAMAIKHRDDLKSAQHRERAAEAAIQLAIAEGRPNLVVGGFVQREEGIDDILGASLGVSLPLFNRNQGPIAESRARRERLRFEGDSLRLAIEQEVVVAFNNLRAARASAEYLRNQVLGTLEENVELLQRSFSAGRIGATEVLTLRREFVASRREVVEALTNGWLARLRLDLATGRSSTREVLK